MNRIFFFVFFTIFVGLYFLLHKYLYHKGIWALSETKYQSLFKWFFWTLAFSFIIGQFLERGNPTVIGRIISFAGSLWIAWFFYLLLMVVAFSFLMWILKIFHVSIPQLLTFVPNGLLAFISIVILSLGIVIYGFINAGSPVVRHVELKIDKKLTQPLTFALVSDLHLGNNISHYHIQKMVKLINENHPDLVLIAGDLVDHNPKFAIKDKVGVQFTNIKAPLGIFAVTGNHEYIGDAEMSIAYLSKYGVQYLRDTMVNVQNKVIIAGREDRQKAMVTQQKRKPVLEILQNQHYDLPVILMDHQPVEYQQVDEAKVDVMLSGHTHKGQLFPLNFITQRVFENHYGLMRKNHTWFYTTNGFGTWGPQVRVGNTPEVVIFTLKN